MLRKISILIFSLCILYLLCISALSLDITAKGAVLINADTKEILYGLNENSRLPMASTTKIMTAIVVIEKCNLDDKVLISAEMTGAEGSSIYLKAGEILSFRELLYGLMLSSANDAAEAIAISVAGSVDSFAQLMNNKAKDLGLMNTHFTNPHGLDNEEHYTTAFELATITAYCLNNRTFSEIVSSKTYTIPETELSSERVLVNHNKLLNLYDGCKGVKTGFTKRCGRCLVTAADAKETTLISVTLGCYDDWNAHTALLDYGFSLYKEITLAEIGSLRFSMPVLCGNESKITVSNKDALKRYMRSGASNIKCIIESTAGRYICAPIVTDEHLADAVFYEADKEIARIPLYAEGSVDSITE